MKIAHIGNTAGVGSILANEQLLKGHVVDVFVFDDITQKQFGGIKINYVHYHKWLFHQKLESYDVWHYHYPYGTLRENLEKRRRNKIYLKHYHGDDLRNSGRIEQDFCLVATPDLLKLAPNGKWLPNPITIEKNNIQSLKEEPRKIPVIAHYPYYEQMKSYADYYSNTLSILEKEGKCNVKTIFNIPHATALEIIANCDIVVGKIIPEIGWFGKFELEGMSLGKPVIGFVSDDLYDQFRPPVYRTTKETFEKDLVSLISDNSKRVRLSMEGLEYVRKNHSAKIVAETLEKYYTTTKQ